MKIEIKKTNPLKNYFVNLLFFTLPISMIAGNLAINLNIIFFSLFSFFFYKNDILNHKFNTFDKLIFFFFIYTFFSLIINLIENLFFNKQFENYIIIKTFLFFRYFFLYFLIRVLIKKEILNIYLFTNICGLAAIFVSLDIFFQFYFKTDIFGYPSRSNIFSGPFGKELIAGGYLQKFGLIAFLLPLTLKRGLKQNLFIIFLLSIFFLFSIILSGNRMPLILYLFSLIIFFNFSFKNKKIITSLLFSVLIIIILAFNSIPSFKYKTNKTVIDGKAIVYSLFFTDMKKEPIETWKKPYVREFYCGKEIAKKNIFFGGGLKSYRFAMEFCNTHPHNYYLEIISDLGLFGLLILLSSILILNFDYLRNLSNIQDNNENLLKTKKIILPYLIIIILEFFPFRTSGSFFTTNNASTIFIILGILVALISMEHKLQSK